MSEERIISLAGLATLEERTYGPGGGRKLPLAQREEIENLLRWPDEGVSARVLAEVLGVAEEIVETLAAQGVLPRDGEGLFPLTAAMDAYVAHRGAAPDAVELESHRTAQEERRRIAQGKGDNTAASNPVSRFKWTFAWPAYVRDREGRLLAAQGIAEKVESLRPSKLAKQVWAEYEGTDAQWQKIYPVSPKPRVMEAWFKKWEADPVKAEVEMRRATAKLEEMQRAQRNT